MSEWIRCSERMPEYNKAVIFCTKWGDVRRGYFRDVSNMRKGSAEWRACGYSYRNVTHWMPSPEPPQESA